MNARFATIENAGEFAQRLAPPVGWLYSADYGAVATCFLVHDWWIATAGHVMPDRSAAGDFTAVFNFHETGRPDDRDARALCPQAGFLTTLPLLDVTFVRLCRRNDLVASPAGRFGRVAIDAPISAMESTPAVLIHHPDPIRYKVASTGSVTSGEGSLVHTAEADYGSSGAPLFDLGGRWIGIHTGKLAESRASSAVSAADLVRRLRNMEIPAELRDAIGEIAGMDALSGEVRP